MAWSQAGRNGSSFSRGLIYNVTGLLLLAVAGYSIWYLSSSYTTLSGWYTGLGNCFYRIESWQERFFTPQIKMWGNRFCIIALILSLSGWVYIIRNGLYKISRFPRIPRAFFKQPDKVLVVLSCLVCWWVANTRIATAYDEIFSAVNIASLHPFQALSYYMLPNNHVLFNVLNSVCFFGVDDKVLSARFLSLLAYILSMLLAYRLIREFIRDRLVSFFLLWVLMLQTGTWAFAAQGRGYMLQQAMGWWSLYALYFYIRDRRTDFLIYYALSVAAGYATAPTFLYFHAFLLLLQAGWQLNKRKSDMAFWISNLLAFGLVYIFYLPLFCFSGTAALFGNHYVQSPEGRWYRHLPGLLQRITDIVLYAYAIYHEKWRYISGVLWLLPLFLFFFRRKENKQLAFVYVSLWSAFILICLYMKTAPPNRATIGVLSVSLALSLYTLYALLRLLPRVGKSRICLRTLMITGLLLYAAQMFRAFDKHVPMVLYGPDPNELFRENKQSIASIPAGSSVAFSHESFYWFYQCRKWGYRVYYCPQGGEDFYVKRGADPLPDNYKGYMYVGDFPDDYQLFRKP